MKRSAADRGDALETALQRAARYRDQAEKLGSWAEECEAGQGRVQTAVDPVVVENSLSQLKALQKDVDKHRGALEQLNLAADSLLEAANADTEGKAGTICLSPDSQYLGADSICNCDF